MDRVVTLFGGGGFIGRYAARELMRLGARVRIASRHPKAAWFVKTQGGLGQTQFVAADLGRAETVKAAVSGASAVVNLVGIMKGDYQAVHVDGARALAQAARAAGAEAFVQLSAIGADQSSQSNYARSKAEGEAAVREAFPGATILRPSVVFGPEDDFINRFARMARLPILPVLRGGTRFQPVYVADVARAIARAAMDPEHHAGHTYELGGPEVMTMAEINDYAAQATGRKPSIVPLPDAVGELMTKFGFLPGAPITRDQWILLQRDNVVAPGAESFEAFGSTPTPLEAVAPEWLVRYRKHGRFAREAVA